MQLFGFFWTNREFQPVRSQSGSKVFQVSLLLFFFPFIWLFLPPSLLPFSSLQRLLLILVPDILFSFYHYAAQHYGLLCLYRNKNVNQERIHQEKVFCLFFVGLLPLFIEILKGSFILQKSWSIWRIPYFSEEFLNVFCTIGIFLIVSLTALMMWKCRQESYYFHTYLFSIGMISLSSIIFTPDEFLILWTLQHWLVSVGLKSSMMSVQGHQKKFVLQKALFWIIFWALLSFPLLPLMEIDGLPNSQRMTENWFLSFELLLKNQFWVLFLSAVGVATGWLHYWYDRCVFKQSDLLTRQALKSLIFEKIS